MTLKELKHVFFCYIINFIVVYLFLFIFLFILTIIFYIFLELGPVSPVDEENSDIEFD